MAAVAPILIDRADVHKSCKSLEGIVTVLSNYTEAADALAAAQKKLAKALKEAANIKGTNSIPANAMINSAGVFEALAEVDSKFAKVADKEAENVGSELRKWFKKLAKEEKAHDDRITSANAKIRQAGQAYEKKAKRKDRDVSDEHTRYLAILNSVGPEMSQDKYNHCLMVTRRHTLTLSGCAASVSRLAEAEWARACESVRRSAPCIGGVGEGRALCEAGWSGPVPNDLPDLGTPETERGIMRNNDPSEKAHDAPRTLMPPPHTSVNNYPDSPTSPLATRTLPSTGRSSETNSADHSQPLPGRPSSPPIIPEPTNLLRKKRSDSAATAPSTLPQTESNEAPGSSTSTGFVTVNSAASDSLSASLGDIRPPLPTVDEQETSPSMREDTEMDGTIKPESKPSHPHLPQEPPPPFTSRESLPGDRAQAKIVDITSDHERDRKASVPPPVSPGTISTTGALDRRVSVESTTSNASLVAAMRGRYDTPAAKPASPPPRDVPRLAQSVTDLATRYTPIDPPTSPQRGLAAERFPTFQDRYPRNSLDRERDRYRSPPTAPAPERDYFTERDNERYHPSPATVDRNRFLRDDRERYRPRSPDRFYADEMGVRDRPRRIDPVADERALREREDQLRERERQLDIERARLREGGYVSDTSSQSPRNAYGAGRRNDLPGPVRTYDSGRRNDSPEPISAQSLVPPPQDHSPNCGCQRCSVQFYASSTPSLPRAQERLEPPIKLRPDKPKSWLRRMSLDVIAQSKSKDVVGANMALPEEDVRVRRRSFESEREKEAAMRFGGTTRR